VLIAAAAFVALWKYKQDIMKVIGICALLGLESHGLLAISKGRSLNFADDHTMLKHGMVIYDALYAWCADTPLQQIARFLGA
jgi:hypothetical protein